MRTAPKPGLIISAIGALLAFIAGFLPWATDNLEESLSAWSTSSFVWPTWTVTGIVALALGVIVLIDLLGSLPDHRVWTFTVDQLALVVGAGATISALAFLITFRDYHLRVGAFLTLVAALLILVGGIVETVSSGKEAATAQPRPWGAPPPGFGFPQAQASWGQPPGAQPPVPTTAWGQPTAQASVGHPAPSQTGAPVAPPMATPTPPPQATPTLPPPSVMPEWAPPNEGERHPRQPRPERRPDRRSR